MKKTVLTLTLAATLVLAGNVFAAHGGGGHGGSGGGSHGSSAGHAGGSGMGSGMGAHAGASGVDHSRMDHGDMRHTDDSMPGAGTMSGHMINANGGPSQHNGEHAPQADRSE